MAVFRVDSDAVAQSAAQAQASIARLQAEIATLQGNLHNVQTSWSGSAADAFQNIVTQWLNTQRRVEDDLTTLTTALGAAARHYEELEHSTMRLFLG